jgi:mediator of RNA polymerase II transcription subunit 13
MELSENETKRDKMTFENFSSLKNNGQTSLLHNSNNNTSISHIRNEELSKMFPTPPSIEQHTNSSPGGVSGNISDGLMESMEMTSNTRSDSYHSFGSPPEEPIDDWSYVFIPQKMSTIVSSSKYAPLNNLLSQTLPALNLPTNCAYKPSWIKQKEQEEVRKMQMESTIVKSEPMKKEPKETSTIDNRKDIKMEVMSPMSNSNNNNTKPFPMTSPFGPRSIKSEAGSTIINKLLSQPSPSPIFKNSSVHLPLESPSTSNMQNNYNSPYGQDSMIRKTMGFPMAPAHHSEPPPPYGVAIHSPSLNSNLNAANNDDISNNNKKTSSKNSSFNRLIKNGQKAPEASSLLVNVLLYDTSLNIFRDHNFDSCTICVCNAGPKCVGNIRGLDSGIYLSLAASCHFNENLMTIVERSQEGKLSGAKRDQKGIKYMGNNQNLMNHQSTDSPRSISSISSCTSSGSSSSSSSGSSSSSSEAMSS